MPLASDTHGRPLSSAHGGTELPPPAGVNKNTNWLSSTGAWAFYVGLIALLWLLVSLFVDPGLAWTWVNIIHGVGTFYLFHWVKGSPIDADQGKYDRLTFWEQLDDGVQFTGTRKFFTAVPVILLLLATHGTDYQRQPLGVNLGVALTVLVSKVPALHKVRIFGINKD